MRSSDTPETDPDDAGPADWSQEQPSDDLLSPEVARKLEQLRLRAAAGQEPEPEP
jgi:hypothetical protein